MRQPPRLWSGPLLTHHEGIVRVATRVATFYETLSQERLCRTGQRPPEAPAGIRCYPRMESTENVCSGNACGETESPIRSACNIRYSAPTGWRCESNT